MSDYGDFCREQREFKRATRSQWVECNSPGCQFGGNPIKVAPGEACRHCGVIAPSRRGSDVAYAQLSLRTCRMCGKVLGNEQGRVQHERDKHLRQKIEA